MRYSQAPKNITIHSAVRPQIPASTNRSASPRSRCTTKRSSAMTASTENNKKDVRHRNATAKIAAKPSIQLKRNPFDGTDQFFTFLFSFAVGREMASVHNPTGLALPDH